MKDEEKITTPNVIYIKTNEENQNSKFNFTKCLKYIKKHVYYVVGATLVLGIVGYLCNQFIYNKSKNTLNCSFTLNAPIENEYNTNGEIISTKYKNGHTFDINYFISKENLQSILDNKKDADGNLKYSSLFIDKLAENNTLTIQYLDQSKLQIQLSAKPNGINYELFGELMSDIATSIIDYSKQVFASYTVVNNELIDYTSLSNSNDIYDVINSYNEQYTLINTTYAEIISYSSTASVNTSYSDFKNINRSINNLEYSISNQKLYYYNQGEEEQTISKIKYIVNTCITKYTSNKQSISNLYLALNSSSSDTNINNTKAILEQIDNLTNENILLLKKLNNYGYSYNETSNSFDDNTLTDTTCIIYNLTNNKEAYYEKCADLPALLENINSLLTTHISTVNKYYNDIIYLNNISVNFDYINKYDYKVSLNPAIGTIIGLLLGFILSSIAVCYYGSYKDKENEVVYQEINHTEENKLIEEETSNDKKQEDSDIQPKEE